MKKLCWIFFGFLLLASCQKSGQPLTGSQPLLMGTTIPIGDLNPFGSLQGMEAVVIDFLYRPLWKIDQQGKLKLELAQELRWEEGRRLHVKLKEDFAEDVLYTFEQISQKGRTHFQQEAMRHLREIQVLSPRELVFDFDRYDRLFLLAQPHMLIVPRQAGQTTGDFVLVSQSQNEVVLRRKVLSPRLVNEIRVKVMPDARQAVRALVAGRLNLLPFMSANELRLLQDLPEIQVRKLASPLLYTLIEYRLPSQDQLREKVAWQEIDRLINRAAFLDYLGSEFKPTSLPVPQEYKWFYQPNSFNASGQSPGLTKRVTLPTRTLAFLNIAAMDEKLARILKRKLAELGFSIVLESLNVEDFSFEKKFDLLLLPHHISSLLFYAYMGFHSSADKNNLNIWHYYNPAFDRLIEQARYSEREEDFQQAFIEAMTAMQQDPPGLFLFWQDVKMFYRSECSGFQVHAVDFAASIKDMRCEPSAVN